MDVDTIISYLHAAVKVLNLAVTFGVPGSAALTAAADALEKLAENRALVESIFNGVMTLKDLGEQLINWLHGNGHSLAAKYLTTMAP